MPLRARDRAVPAPHVGEKVRPTRDARGDKTDKGLSALIFDLKRDCSEDGPGIRTTVFLKGCPLSCVWCQNPEGVGRHASVSFRRELCHPQACGTPCVSVCPTQCLRLQADPPSRATESGDAAGLEVRPDLCSGCGRCFERCPYEALEPVGYTLELEELLYRVLVDKPFYASTGGGVTLSGGEPTLQMAFLEAFLKRLKAEGVSTAIETCGFFNYRAFSRRILPWLDRIYYDIKLIDEARHRRYTGRSNRPILANLERLAAQARIPVQVRIPLIPGITTSERNLSGIARFLRANGIRTANLMPYNPLWRDKLERLGLEARYEYRGFMTQREQAACVACMSPDRLEA